MLSSEQGWHSAVAQYSANKWKCTTCTSYNKNELDGRTRPVCGLQITCTGGSADRAAASTAGTTTTVAATSSSSAPVVTPEFSFGAAPAAATPAAASTTANNIGKALARLQQPRGIRRRLQLPRALPFRRRTLPKMTVKAVPTRLYFRRE
jgi:hypothetical protein